MPKSAIFLCLVFMQYFELEAQNRFYDYLQPGEFSVGFKDTLIFDSVYQYKAFHYEGFKPFFIQIWHPLSGKITNQKFLTVKNLFDSFSSAKNKLISVQNQLKKHYQEIFIRDFIEENLATGNANDFGKYNYNDILRFIGEIKTKSVPSQNIENSQFPVIVYHHGSQSFPFENFAMAEYFASRGFVFICANFHLPYENTIFGLQPFDRLINGEDEQSLRFILRFARSFTKSKSVFFIGHSWGAQMGLRALGQEPSIKGFVSLETTIEFKTDIDKIKEMWPEVFQKVMVEKACYPFPVLFCAATGNEKPFEFFENLKASRIVFAATREEFEHNAYLSAFYLRLFIHRRIMQTDTKILKDRLKLYVQHINLIDDFINGILKNESKPKTEVLFVK